MSTIASPRDPSAPLRRVPSNVITPTSSTRPSLDVARSSVTSPVNSSGPGPGPLPVAKRANRAALREYYNLRNAAAAAAAASSPPPPRIGVELPDSEVPVSDLDIPGFTTDEYVAKAVAENSLGDLLRLYTRVVGEVRALDAEKKALVYDNYSKLIAATETIRKMRSNMDPLNPMASTLNPAIAQIYRQAAEIRETLRASIPAPDSDQGKQRAAAQRRKRTRELAVQVLATPERLRRLVAEGKLAEARKQWERPRRLLQTWHDKGFGGDEVQACIDEGDAAVAAPTSSEGRLLHLWRTSLQLRNINNRERVLVVLAQHHCRLGHRRPQLLLQRRPQHLLQVAALRVAVKHLHQRSALLNRPQRRVVARLAHNEEVHVGALEHVVSATRADAVAANPRRAHVGAHRRRHHDVSQAAEFLSEPLEDLGDGDGLAVGKGGERAVARAGVALGRRLARDGDGARGRVRAGYSVGEPRVETSRCGVDGRVRAVHGDAGLHETNEGGLLGVLVGDGLETGEDEGV
ncbi:Vacuolar protein sorting-associated protein 51 [Beauveria bassiana]|uniref:Vacuolar protein sorting-associated protein 51 homolog n=1 Tax=Beauveria bassiana TaxID=176275 RepID=A0A2N6NSV9_BEABA|nr:Vacuolar protein sorting-associated protein 51 [Beauveria bassiana]